MDKDLAKTLLPLVNELNAMEALNLLIDSRIDFYHRQLEFQGDRDCAVSQGAIAELRFLKNIRDRVLDKVK